MRRKIPLSELREVGWSHWDPISLKDNRKDCEGEYDAYLVRAYSMAIDGKNTQDIADYLARVETESMGLGTANLANAVRAAEEIIGVAKTL